MSKLPALKPVEVIKVLVNKAGFVVHHVTGSHYILRHPDGRRLPVPYHNKDLKTGRCKGSSSKLASPGTSS